jgi:uncharacterized YigZ family protein
MVGLLQVKDDTILPGLHGKTGLFIIFRRINGLLRYMIASFHTINGSSAGEYKEKGSKFIALAFPVASEEEVKARLLEIKMKYFDARHHCYAYVLGADKSKFRAYDDGEPNHSAGDPILGQIRSKNLTNVLVIVVRYFGGTKLGVGGLVTAYKAAAEEALNRAQIVEQQVSVTLVFELAYEVTPAIMKLVKDFDLRIISQEYGETCSLTAEVPLLLKNNLLERIRLLNMTGTVFTVSLRE